MTKGNGLPCVKCGTSEWNKWGDCCECKREGNRRWRQSNPARSAEHQRRYRQANHDEVIERTRRWQQANPEKMAASYRRYRQANLDKVVDKNHRWNQANPDKVSANKSRRRTRKTEAGGSYTAAEFKALCDHYGNKCLRCKRTDVKLEFDHVIPVSKGGTSDISNGQPLCRSCNSAKKDRHIDYRPDAGPLRWLQSKLFG